MEIGIFGSSGFAREVADICVELGYTKIFFIDKEQGIEPITGFEIVSEQNVYDRNNTIVSYVIGIGDGNIRSKILKKHENLNFVNLIHPTATFGIAQASNLEKTKGNIICAGVRLTNNISLGNFGLLNLNVTIGHDCVLEDFVTISPGANVSGNVHIHEGSYIGTGSTILEGKNLKEKLHIGEKSIVGAGAVVVKDVPVNVVVKGIPAK